MSYPYTAPVLPSAPTPPWWKRLWFVALAALVIGLVIGAGGASSSTKKASATTSTATVTSVQTSVSTEPGTTQTRTLRPTVIKTVATKTRTATVTFTPRPKPAINDGTYQVGRDINPGTWRTEGGDCYWERDANLSGSIDSIIANDNITGQSIVQLNQGEYFTTNGGCDWRHD